MTYLPSLIKKIDNFYQLIEARGLIATGAPEDMALYNALTEAAEEVLNPDVSYTLKILAEMFRKAIELDGGYNTIYKTISGIIEDLDTSESEQANVENLLNRIADTIRARASKPDSALMVRELQTAASDAKRNLSSMDFEETPEDRDDEISTYEASLTGYAEAPEEVVTPYGEKPGAAPKAEEVFREEGGKEVFDPTAGMSPEEAGKGKGRGYSRFTARTYKDWAEVYAREKERYQRDLEAPENMVTKAVQTARQSSPVRINLKSLIDVLDQLEPLTREAREIEKLLSIEGEASHPTEDRRMTEIRASLRALEKHRISLKKSLSKFYKTAELQNLQKALTEATDPKEQFILQQKIDLQQLLLSNVSGYGAESKRRRVLIDALTVDPNLPADTIRRQLAAIQDAAQLTAKITDMYRKRAEELARARGYKPTEIRTKRERVELPKAGVTVKRHEYDFANMNLTNYTKGITDSLFAKRKTFKDAVLRGLKSLGVEELRQYVDDVATAANKGANIGWAAHRLSEQIRLKQKMGQAVPKKEIMAFLFSIRVSKLLYQYRDQLNQVNKWLGLDPKSKETTEPDFTKLDPVQIQIINQAIQYGEDLISRFKSYEARLPFTGGLEEHPELGKARIPVPFGPVPPHKGQTVTDWLQKTVDYLKQNLEAIGALNVPEE